MPTQEAKNHRYNKGLEKIAELELRVRALEEGHVAPDPEEDAGPDWRDVLDVDDAVRSAVDEFAASPLSIKEMIVKSVQARHEEIRRQYPDRHEEFDAALARAMVELSIP